MHVDTPAREQSETKRGAADAGAEGGATRGGGVGELIEEDATRRRGRHDHARYAPPCQSIARLPISELVEVASHTWPAGRAAPLICVSYAACTDTYVTDASALCSCLVRRCHCRYGPLVRWLMRLSEQAISGHAHLFATGAIGTDNTWKAMKVIRETTAEILAGVVRLSQIGP